MNDEFETEVVRTLAGLAKVDPATLAETRASIAALPDRGSTTMARFRRPLRIGYGRTSPALALAGVVAIVVAVVAVSAFGRFQGGPATPGSATPASATPGSASPSIDGRSAQPTSTPGSEGTPSPVATTVTAFHETLPVVYTGDSLYVLGWSPDGSRFAILDRTIGSPQAVSTSTAYIFDRKGAQVGSVEASYFAWLDESGFVIIRSPVAADVTPAPSHAYLGHVGSTAFTDLGVYDTLVAGPSGSVALTLPWNHSLKTPPQYAVLSGGIASSPREGYPSEWSPDGSALALFHVTSLPGGVGSQPTGWLEVVRPTGESLARVRKGASEIISRVAFSPDGARLAFEQGGQILVLEVASGRLSSIPAIGAVAWTGADEMLFVDYSKNGISTGQIRSWSATTGQLATYGDGDIVGSSGDGAVVTGRAGRTGSIWYAASTGRWSNTRRLPWGRGRGWTYPARPGPPTADRWSSSRATSSPPGWMPSWSVASGPCPRVRGPNSLRFECSVTAPSRPGCESRHSIGPDTAVASCPASLFGQTCLE